MFRIAVQNRRRGRRNDTAPWSGKGVIVGLLTRNPEIVAREIDDTVFLVGTGNDSVLHLNPIGAAIWKLLAEAFPDLPTDKVGSDVEKLLGDLDSRGFLLRID